MATKQYKSMICLVGENPLPIYIGIRRLSAPNAIITLAYSEDGTEIVAKMIKSRVASDNKSFHEEREVKFLPINDPYDPKSVGNVIGGWQCEEDAALNITGGTKVMSAFAVDAWKGKRENIFYIEDARRKIHYGSGVIEDIGDMDLTVKDLCDLHGIILKESRDELSIPTTDDLRTLLQQFLRNNRRCHFPFQEFHDFDFANFIDIDIRNIFDNCMAMLSEETKQAWKLPTRLPGNKDEYKDSRWKLAFDFFAKYQWFECLIHNLIKDVLGSNSIGIQTGEMVFRQECTVSNQFSQQNYDPLMFEGDILLVVNNRLRYVSVTTSIYPDRCKEKMFEAMHRARQIGGDMASSCVVSLAYPDIVANCRTSIDEHPRHTIYGQKDVNSWVNGHPESLLEFLTRDF
jgi:hypothetical protein